MKKIFYSMLVAGAMFAFASCDEGNYADWSDPQQYAQETVAEAVGLTANSATSNAAYIDFATDLAEYVKVVNVSIPSEYNATYSLNFKKGEEATEHTLEVSQDGKVKTEDLKNVVEAIYGKAPVLRTLDADLIAVISVNGVAVKAAVPVQIFVQLTAPAIAEHYYIVGGTLDWKSSCESKELAFQHSSLNVYDDPVFTITFAANPDGDTWFAIGDDEACDAVAKDNDWTKLYGTTSGNGKSGEEGMLKRRSELSDDGSFCVAGGSKFINVEINMMDGTYKVKALNFSEFVYEIGNESEWKENHALRGENFDGLYQGYYYLDGEFKFKPNADNWDGDMEYVANTATNGTDEDRASDYVTGSFSTTGDSNFPAMTGFYELNLDLATNTYKFYEVKSITMVGDFNGWNQADAATHMTYDKTAGCWTIKYTFESKAKVKFAMNDNWNVSWGGANGDDTNYENLTQNSGKDLTVPAGEYTVKLYLSREGTNRVVFDGEAAPATGTGELYLTGSNYGWGGETGTWLPLIPVNGTEDTFWRMIYLHADEQFKFAPYAAWKEDFGFGAADVTDTMAGLCDEGGNFKATNAGWYLLKVVNPTSGKPSVTVMAPEVYLIGSTAAAEWSIAESGKFEVPTTDADPFVSPAFAADGEVRMCVTAAGVSDWWKTEFIGLDGKLEYRGNGDDQQRVSVTAGQKAYVNFTTGTVEYK